MTIKSRLNYTLVFISIWTFIYFGVQGLAENSKFNFLTDIDEAIPLMPEFIWIYHSLIPVIFGTMVWLVKDRSLFFNMFWASVVATVVLNISYAFLPSFYPRAEFAVDGLSESLLYLTRELDGANNTFPSSHVTFSWLISLVAVNSQTVRSVRGFGSLFLLWAIGVSMSTLVLKQHYIVDVAAGIALSFAAFYGVKWLRERYLYRGSLLDDCKRPEAT